MKPNFKRKERRVPDKCLYAPVSGRLIPLNLVSDPVYASKMYGDGVAILPGDDIIVAPCFGTLTLVSASKHAFGIETDQNEKVYVHVGFGTAEMRGKGFEVLAAEGTKLKPGMPVLRVDRKFFENRGIDLTTVMVVTTSKPGDYRVMEGESAAAGKTPLLEHK